MNPGPIRKRTVRVLGRTVVYYSTGDGPPVLLLHGNGSFGREVISPFRRFPGFCWIAPDRPGYGASEPFPSSRTTPVATAVWTRAFIDALGMEQVTVVAHSIACAGAMVLAATERARLSRVVLINPFCRPSREAWMPLLRLATHRWTGPAMRRWVLPRLAPLLVRRALRTIAAGRRLPRSLIGLPFENVFRPESLRATAGELRSFNAGMVPIHSRIRVRVPARVIVGTRDPVADPAWHLPFVAARTENLAVDYVDGGRHVAHHEATARIVAALRESA